MARTTIPRKKVAIIGGGSAGIAALWALNRTPHDVYIYEAGSQLGAHTDAVEFRKGKYRAAVDTGFILNTAIHPNFFAFLKTIGVETERTDMTTSISRDDGRFEWAATSIGAIFAQRQNLLNIRMWRMLFDILRFNQFALDLLKQDENGDLLVKGVGFQTSSSTKPETIGEYLDREGYSSTFRNDYLIPSTVGIWTSSSDTGFEHFPAAVFVRLMWENDLLKTFRQKSDWRTITQGARSYIEAVMKGFPPNHILLNSPVESVATDEAGNVIVTLEDDTNVTFDHVIIATHADQAKALLLPKATNEERDILSSFERKKHVGILHSDVDLMPRNKETWASCNYITRSTQSSSIIDKVSITYNMNQLQHIPKHTFGDILVTLNPIYSPKPQLIQGKYKYSQILYNATTISSQARLSRIQNVRGISYCGAWTESGLREDDFSSGLKIAQEHLGAKLPFKFVDHSSTGEKRPDLGLAALLLRLVLSIVQFFILFAERLWHAQIDTRRDVGDKLRGHVKHVQWRNYKTNGWHKSQ